MFFEPLAGQCNYPHKAAFNDAVHGPDSDTNSEICQPFPAKLLAVSSLAEK